MGEVYEALDIELGRKVAVKVLPEEMAEDVGRLERFRREAKAVAALNHPNIVTIHGIEESEGRRFLIMEKVEGESLDRKLPRNGFPLEELLEIAIPIADALAATHDKGIIHRDLKPANVMVTGEGRVKLLDFGLAKLTETATPRPSASADDETTTALLTREGTVLGTAPYMSPEQLRGEDIDTRSDVFSFGTMLYEMATGRRPFQGTSAVDLASSILKDQPPSIVEVREELPRQLGRIVESCLEKNPDRRFQTARDVCNQLQALKREASTGSRQEASSVGERGRSRGAWLAAALVAAVIGAGAFYLARLGSSGDVPASATEPSESLATLLDDGRLMLAVLPFENLGDPEDEYFADGISEEIRSRLAMLDGLGVVSRTTARQFKADRPPLPEIARELKVDYIVEGTVRWQPGPDGGHQVRVSPQLIRVSQDRTVWAESYTSVPANIFEVQTDIAQRVAEELDLEILEPQRRMFARKRTESPEAYATYLQAEELFERGKELESQEPIVAAIELYEEAVAQDPTFAVVHARLAEAHGSLAIYGLDRSEARVAAGVASAAKALELAPDSPDSHYAQGLVHHASRDFLSAGKEFRLVMQRWPNYAQAFWMMGQYDMAVGRWEEGLANATKAVQLNPRAAQHHCMLGGMNIASGYYEEAISHHQRAIKMAPERSCPYYCLLEASVSAGNVAKAERFLAGLPKGLSLEENPSIAYHWVRIDVIQKRYQEGLARLRSGPAEAYRGPWMYVPKSILAAQIYEMQGLAEDARAEYEIARAHLEPRVEENPFDIRNRGTLAIAYGGLGRREDAIRQQEAGLPMVERGGIAKPWAIRQFAHARVLLGDYEEAVDLLRQHLEFSSYMGAEYLKIYPTWDPLRDRPDFQALMAQYGSGMH